MDDRAAAYLLTLEVRVREAEAELRAIAGDLRTFEADLAKLHYYCRCVEDVPSRAEWGLVLEQLGDLLAALRHG